MPCCFAHNFKALQARPWEDQTVLCQSTLRCRMIKLRAQGACSWYPHHTNWFLMRCTYVRSRRRGCLQSDANPNPQNKSLRFPATWITPRGIPTASEPSEQHRRRWACRHTASWWGSIREAVHSHPHSTTTLAYLGDPLLLEIPRKQVHLVACDEDWVVSCQTQSFTRTHPAQKPREG